MVRDYKSPGSNARQRTLQRIREEHGRRLVGELNAALQFADQRREVLDLPDGAPPPDGVYLEVELAPGVGPTTLERKRERTRQGAVTVTANGARRIALFVPDDTRDVFDAVFRDYAFTEVEDGEKIPKKSRVEPVEHVRTARLQTFWRDDPDALPDDPQAEMWWALWCFRDRVERVDDLAQRLGLTVGDDDTRLRFPEVIVLPVHGRRAVIELLLFSTGGIAEIRRATDTPAVFTDELHGISGVLKATEDLGSRNIAAHARLDGPNRLIAGEHVIEAKRIVLAPGSSPIVPEQWRAFGDRIITSDTLFEQKDLPRRIGVVGLGAIGVEIAQALARLGIEVYGFDGADRIAGVSDERIAQVAQDLLAQEFAIHLGAQVELAEADDGIEMRWDGGNVVVDKVIASVGRRPNLKGLGLDTLGVPLDDKGMPEVDSNTMRIGDTTIFLAGDANGQRPLLHEGADDGHIAGLNATSENPIHLSRRIPLSVVFSDPQIASVGQRAGELNPRTILTGEVSFARQGRARTMQENYGLLRLYAARENGRLLGAEMVAPAAEHMGHLLALAIGQKLTVHDLLRMPFYHPTLEEGLRTALRMIARELPPCSISDLAGCGPIGVEALE